MTSNVTISRLHSCQSKNLNFTQIENFVLNYKFFKHYFFKIETIKFKSLSVSVTKNTCIITMKLSLWLKTKANYVNHRL